MNFVMHEETSGRTVLHRAAKAGDYDSVEFLLELFDDNLKKLKTFLTIKDVQEETALHKASKIGNTEIVKLLLNSFETEKEKMNYILQGTNTRNALFYAVNGGYKDTVEVFLGNKLSKEFLLRTYSTKENILHKTRDSEIFKLILKKVQKNRNTKLKKFLNKESKVPVYKTPLKIAMKNNLPKLAWELIKANLDIDAKFSPITLDLDWMKQFWKKFVKEEEFNAKLKNCNSLNKFFKELITINIDVSIKQKN
jgi:ankyrin repeat protein